MSIVLHLYKIAIRVRNKVSTFLIRSSFGSFGRKSVIVFPFRSGVEKSIEVGTGVYIGTSCWIEAIPQDGLEVPLIKIGDDVSMSGFCTITAVSRVTVGKGALIARFVHISDHSHSTSRRDQAIRFQGVSKIAPVEIGEGAWIGHGVVICPGVRIGRNAVVGANSVVRDDVPDYCVAVGVPARILNRSSRDEPSL